MAASAHTILIVDDQPENLAVLADVLMPHYRVRAARSGEQALRAVGIDPKPDVALLDIMMPEMDGFALLARLRENPALNDMPVIFITALGQAEDEQRGLEAGAVDYITKPINPATVLARVRTHLELKSARDQLKQQNISLEAEVAKRTEALDHALHDVEDAHRELKKTYFATLAMIGDLAGLRASELSAHSRRVANLARRVAFALDLEQDEAQNVFIAALLHDIGKVGFPDGLLTKSVATLRSEELGVYRAHPDTGANLLMRTDALVGIADIVRAHHELYNGKGFPKQLSGLNIPLGARIIAAVSDYEDLKGGMLLQQPWSAKQSGQYIIECAGSRYDPKVVAALEPIITKEGKYEIDEIRVNVNHLQENMVLSRDIRDPQGFVLLAKGSMLTHHLIEQLASLQQASERRIMAYVVRAAGDPLPTDAGGRGGSASDGDLPG